MARTSGIGLAKIALRVVVACEKKGREERLFGQKADRGDAESRFERTFGRRQAREAARELDDSSGARGPHPFIATQFPIGSRSRSSSKRMSSALVFWTIAW